MEGLYNIKVKGAVKDAKSTEEGTNELFGLVFNFEDIIEIHRLEPLLPVGNLVELT